MEPNSKRSSAKWSRTSLWAAAAALVLAARLAHAPILWVEEAYPAAAAIQMLHGLVPYRDFFFDKPPLSALFYLLCGGYPGWPLRVVGALFVIGCAGLAWFGAGRLAKRAGPMAALLCAVYLTFDFPAATLALSPDILMVAAQLGAFACLAAAMPLGAGVCAALAFLLNFKGLTVLVVALIWMPRRFLAILAGFAIPVAATGAMLLALNAWPAFVGQVWTWGRAYAADTFLENPLREGLFRTVSWAAFHLTIVLAAIPVLRRDRRLLAWVVLSAVAVTMGWRFFPRYYFQLLPPLTIAAAAALATFRQPVRIALLALLAIPVIRFGPRYVSLAIQGDATWADTAMNRDSRRVAAIIKEQAKPRDTILVWGYRPDILVYTRLPLGAPYLDSQPLTGVIADRHLRDSRPTYNRAADRAQLAATYPTFLVDGLGPYNPELAIHRYPELHHWLKSYNRIADTEGARVYRLNPDAAPVHPSNRR
ncbi:MAG: DUF2029 domain-containing protein [Bryobacterales bacterium]|nr:DUF2029 domain-containing protein [Bryobacterales bacterium]